MRRRHATLAVVTFLVLVVVPAGQPASSALGPSTPDDQARLLAGLSVPAGSPLEALSAAPAVARHAASLSRTWQALDDQMLSKMRAWAGKQIDPRIGTSAPLAYIFGGPDFLMAHAMFPSAPVYVLTGLEPVGRVPPLETLAPAAFEAGLDNLRSSMDALPTRGYFITSDMGRDLSRTELRGVMPVLYLFLARTGHRLLESTAICLDPAGQVQQVGAGVAEGHVPGVRIVFQGDVGRAPQTLYYFSVDLEAGPIAKTPGFFQFMNALPAPNAYLKAAFAAAGSLEPLPFKTGYSKPGRSNLMLAIARR